jgi:hypothetical protein
MRGKKKRNMDYKHYENIINYLFYVSLVILKLIEIVSFKARRVSRCRINFQIRTEFTESDASVISIFIKCVNDGGT